MTRDPRCGVCPSASDIRTDLLTVFVLILVGLGFTLLSATAFADEGSSGSGGSPPKNTFNIMMNYELGMHCTGFEFAYCCVLPPYNSILAQVVKTQRSGSGQGAFAKLLQGDPNVGKDPLNRETVLRDSDLSGSNFQKYVLTYEHQAQPRNDGRGKAQVSTLISAVEGNSLFMWSTIYDQATKTASGAIKTSTETDPYNGAVGAPVGDGVIHGIADSYANGWMNHLYIYSGLEGDNPKKSTLEADKIRLGIDVVFQRDCGPAAHPMGPVTNEYDANGNIVGVKANDCGGLANGNLLTFSGDQGTIVYTQMKVLENLPITLTSPRIWEALGLPLTPFEDSIDFFGDPGLVDEDSIRPYVKMVAKMYRYDPNDTSVNDGDAKGVGAPVLQNGQPVVGFGTAPIDIPNCERCHSNAPNAPNSPQAGKPAQWALVQSEYNFWNAFYDIDTAAGDSDWYSRLKSAAVSMMVDHDAQHGTSFTANYPACGGTDPVNPNDCIAQNAGIPIQNTRMGHESVICQKCHADNVIAAVKSATGPEGQLIRPISEAIHRNHRNATELEDPNDPLSGGPIVFNDSLGRDGGCQGCHPAHRSDGDMAGYPITLDGENFYAAGDNRLASGGCFVGRDVHSNPNKDKDGAETPEHLNAVGEWLKTNVSRNQAGLAGSNQATRGIWCTNCHSQLSQEIWKAENVANLIEGKGICSAGSRKGSPCTSNSQCGTGGQCALNNVRAGSLQQIATQVAGGDLDQVLNWLDPKVNSPGGDTTHAIWKSDPGICKFLTGRQPEHDATVATIEVALSGQACSTPDSVGPVDCSADGGPVFSICGTNDADGDFSVNVLDFCTTSDCVSAAQNTLGASSTAVAVPFSAATDGRDHWLSAGEPHCADCHAAPYVEQSGNINAFAPFNYPRKASLMRYSRGHRDITCQGCHESIHGLYPVTPNIDTTTYAQAASMNSDGSHGPLKCGACHQVNSTGVHSRMDDLVYAGQRVRSSLDAAIGWAHVFTDNHSPLDDMCQNCHGDERREVSAREHEWQEHAMKGRASRLMMNQVEIELLGAVAGTNPTTGKGDANIARSTVCRACHGDEFSEVSCSGEHGREWKQHLAEGRVAETVWEAVSLARTRSTCGW